LLLRVFDLTVANDPFGRQYEPDGRVAAGEHEREDEKALEPADDFAPVGSVHDKTCNYLIFHRIFLCATT
jgi:hypothetical protein